MNRLSKSIITVTIASAASIAPAQTPGDQYREHSNHQQQIRAQTSAVGGQIDAIIAEFNRNGMGETDTHALRALRGVLDQLDENQMQTVIQLLQQAAAGSEQTATSDARQAFAVQQDILASFRKLLLDYERRQGLASLAGRLDQLATRQDSNLRSAVDLAMAAKSRGNGQPASDDAGQAARQTQQLEQSDISAEAADAMSVARSLMHGASGDDAARLSKALAGANAVTATTAAKQAADDLKAGDLYRAASGEKTARDAMRELADELAPPKDALTIKKEQLAALDGLAQNEQNLIDQTHSQTHSQTQASTPDPLAAVARQQAADVDAADRARQKLSNLSPKTADDLQAAEEQMQRARSALASHQRQNAANS
ncbi:MAG: hypothetical protein JO353_07705, partial [Phycisphaerae bacterium]|nr:hypothetical protein [Phycisphaerae bacterium]